MVRGRVVCVVLLALVGLAGCSEQSSQMPDVTGQELDAAKQAIVAAGINEEIVVKGGGVFGVVKESNWVVCQQTPGAGAAVSQAPQLSVARSCDSKDPAEETQAAEQEQNEAADQEQAEASKPEERQEEPKPILTKRNNKALARILNGDNCDESLIEFSAKHRGETIRFNGSIANVAPHGDYNTRYDYLVAPGGKGPESTTGPSFKFEDVNMFDFHLEGATPSLPVVGERFRFTATVEEFDANSCLFFLDPVATRPR